MLGGFLNGLAEHLEPEGEGWLILSDLAEHLGLRRRDELLGAFERAGCGSPAAGTSRRATGGRRTRRTPARGPRRRGDVALAAHPACPLNAFR